MAYTARERGHIAHAVAITGGNILAAVRWLKDNGIEATDASEATVRRLMRREDFCQEVTARAKIIAEENETAIRESERTRLKREMEGSFGERISEMERKGWEIFERLCAEMDKPETDKRELLAFWAKAQDFVVRLKSRAAPAIAELWQAEALIRAYQKTLMKVCGAALTERIQRDVGKEYQLTLTAEQAKAAENAPKEVAPGATAGA